MGKSQCYHNPVKELDAHCAVHAHNICSTCGPDNYKVQACCSPQMEPRRCPSMFAFWEALEEAPMVPPSECDYIQILQGRDQEDMRTGLQSQHEQIGALPSHNSHVGEILH
uniref:Uncharacterized protein n=1 Tax=Opuntia streptacantha TaxID=393608 RepID=A0A7C9AYC1_OPUST